MVELSIYIAGLVKFVDISVTTIGETADSTLPVSGSGCSMSPPPIISGSSHLQDPALKAISESSRMSQRPYPLGTGADTGPTCIRI